MRAHLPAALKIGAIYSGCLFALFLLGLLVAYNPFQGTETVLMVAHLVGTPVLLGFVGLPVCLLIILWQRKVSPAIFRFLVILLMLYSTFLGCLALQFNVQDRLLEHVARRGQPVVSAIQQFTADHGRPPSKLEELLPGYLTALPFTGVPTWHYDYHSQPRGRFRGEPWMLSVRYFRQIGASTGLVRRASGEDQGSRSPYRGWLYNFEAD